MTKVHTGRDVVIRPMVAIPSGTGYPAAEYSIASVHATNDIADGKNWSTSHDIYNGEGALIRKGRCTCYSCKVIRRIQQSERGVL